MQTTAPGRFALGVLLCAWLNLAAQPCLMAMEPAADSSTAAEHSVHSQHNQHSPPAGGAADCGHCPPVASEQAMACEVGAASDCELLPGYNLDGRQFKQLAKDIAPQVAACTLASTRGDVANNNPFLPHDAARLKFDGDPPLNIRHCVFLK